MPDYGCSHMEWFQSEVTAYQVCATIMFRKECHCGIDPLKLFRSVKYCESMHMLTHDFWWNCKSTCNNSDHVLMICIHLLYLCLLN